MTIDMHAATQPRFFTGEARHMLIGGDWVDAASGERFDTLDPATGEVLASIPKGGPEDIDRAVKAARRAFEDGPWSRMNPSERGLVVHRIGDLILEHGDELAELDSLDNGKPVGVARAADVALAADLFWYMAGWATKLNGSTISPSVPYLPGAEFHAYTLREPIGVVGQIIPWNFPLLMAAWKLGPALTTGNTVVLKPAEQTPLSALRLGELMLEAGVPEGVVNIVTGFGEAGAALAAHPDVDKVAFTGSTEVGKLIVQASAGNLKKVSLELGGKSPNVVFSDADIEAAVAGAAQGIFFNQGEVCSAGSRLYVQSDRFDDVVGGHRRGRQGDQGRPRPRPRHRDGPAGLRRAVRARDRLPRPGRQGGRAGADRRPRDRGRRLLRRADRSRRHQAGGHAGPGGDLRAGHHRDAVRRRRRPGPPGQRHRPTAWPPACGRATSPRPTGSPGASRRAPCTSTRTTCSAPSCPSAASSSPGWGREMGEEVLSSYLETKSVITQL
jgi:phenylacetaldehyde dehydrogenase